MIRITECAASSAGLVPTLVEPGERPVYGQTLQCRQSAGYLETVLADSVSAVAGVLLVANEFGTTVLGF